MRTSVDRHSGIDTMRTLAILIMLVANTLPYAESVVPPDWLRLLCSLAAPLFIFLSGYSVHLSKERKDWAAFMPATAVLLSAVLVDVAAWRILPFLEFDVLYLIAIGLFINTALRNYRRLTVWLALFLLGTTPFITTGFNYRFEIDEIALFSSSASLSTWWSLHPGQRLLYDGWFPILPWLFFALLGSAFGHYQTFLLSIRNKLLMLCTIGFVFLALHQLNGDLPSMRDGYVEIFYPMHIGHLLCSTCWVVGLSLWFMPRTSEGPVLALNILGRKSLLVYIAHAFFLGLVVEDTYQPNTLIELISTILLLLIVTFGLSKLAEQSAITSVTTKLPYFIRRLLGL